MKEKEKMLAGMIYDANNDPDILKERYQGYDLCFDLNRIRPSDIEKKNEILKQILPYLPEDLEIITPFYCDYGSNIKFGHHVFVNLGCYFMDGGYITIGDHVFIGPYCGFYTASHPIDYPTRDKGLEQALPITIGDHCWLGANVSIMPGVTIGKGCVIAAGSVVTHDMPDNVMIAGVPAKVIKAIDNHQ